MEPRRDTASARMGWLPFVTFWQVTADMPMATEVPPDEGHNYNAQTVAAWAGVLGMDPRDDYTSIEEAIGK